MRWRLLAYPALLLLAGAAPAVACARWLLARPRLAVAADLSLLWLVLMVWLALGRLRPLEPRPPRRDGASPARVERAAAALLGVADLLGTVVLPVSLAAGGLGLVRSPLRGGPAFAGVAVVVVALVGLARAARAVLLFGRPTMPARLPPPGLPPLGEPGPADDDDGAVAHDAGTAAFAIGSAVLAGVAVGVGAVALVALAAVARAAG